MIDHTTFSRPNGHYRVTYRDRSGKQTTVEGYAQGLLATVPAIGQKGHVDLPERLTADPAKAPDHRQISFEDILAVEPLNDDDAPLPPDAVKEIAERAERVRQTMIDCMNRPLRVAVHFEGMRDYIENVKAANLRRNTMVTNAEKFGGEWVAVPREDFDKLRAAIEAKP